MAEPSKRRVIKKVDGGHGHHGGAWKVAYADFVTAMMALFMVMWLLASTDAQTRKEISNYFRTGVLPTGDLAMNRAAQITPSVIETAPAPPPAGEETLDDAAVDLRNQVSRIASADPSLRDLIKNVRVEVTPEGLLLEVVDQEGGLLFDSASSKLKAPLVEFLRVITPMLNAMQAPIEISGHTDARPFAPGVKVSNWDLSYQRAAAARDIMFNAGLGEQRVAGVFARGSSQPLVKDPMSAQNRRLSILIRSTKTKGPKAAPATPPAPAVVPGAPPMTPPPPANWATARTADDAVKPSR